MLMPPAPRSRPPGLDWSRWPLAIATVVPRDAPPSVLDRLYADSTALLQRREPFVVMMDLRGIHSNAVRRKRFIAWLDENRALVMSYCLGCATVLESAIERGSLTAFLWLYDAPVPMRTFARELEAEDWLLSLLKAKGL